MDVVYRGKSLCITCGADVNVDDLQGNICTLCHKYEVSCTCDPNEVVGPDPLTD